MNKIKKIGVVGAGQMGAGIAQVFAMKGFEITLQDISEEQCKKALTGIEKSLTKLAEKKKITQETARQALNLIATTTSLDDLSHVDFVVEAVTENLELKSRIFSALDRITQENIILATNTSSISITKIAAATNRKDKVIGMHFMNPVPIMPGVEVISADETSKETENCVYDLVNILEKTLIRSKDRAGFVANRILMPMILEAILALEEGVSEKEDIDKGMVTCCNFPMGPLALADFIGLDTCASIMNVMADGLQNQRYRPPALLQRLVKKGKLGRKSGEGFYKYEL